MIPQDPHRAVKGEYRSLFLRTVHRGDAPLLVAWDCKGLEACVHPLKAGGFGDPCTVRELNRKKINVSCSCVGWNFEDSDS